MENVTTRTQRTKKRCFVCLPISTKGRGGTLSWEEFLASWLKPGLVDLGYEVEGGRISPGRDWLKEIIDWLSVSDLVVADLTEQRPNVLYELGVRHAFRGPRKNARTLIITRDGPDGLPSDLSNHTPLTYKYEPGNSDARRLFMFDLKESVKRIEQASEDDPDNPVGQYGNLPVSRAGASEKEIFGVVQRSVCVRTEIEAPCRIKSTVIYEIENASNFQTGSVRHYNESGGRANRPLQNYAVQLDQSSSAIDGQVIELGLRRQFTSRRVAEGEQAQFEINFRPHLGKGQVVRYGYVQEYDGGFRLTREAALARDEQSKGWCGAPFDIVYPTERLELEYVLPGGYEYSEARFFVTNYAGKPIDALGVGRLPEELSEGGRKKLHLVVEHPFLSCKYYLGWWPPPAEEVPDAIRRAELDEAGS